MSTTTTFNSTKWTRLMTDAECKQEGQEMIDTFGKQMARSSIYHCCFLCLDDEHSPKSHDRLDSLYEMHTQNMLRITKEVRRLSKLI